MKTKNAKDFPKVFYGLHMVPGIAEYNTENFKGRILISEQTAKEMNPSFAGKPVYVMHVEDVNLERLQEEADGYVAESFYNPVDGMHWAKFIAVSDKAVDAIRKGWKLSNCYMQKRLVAGGEWHGTKYDQEVIEADYEHLAIVPDPRYQESIILTPEEFKEYNINKSEELKRLTNSKETTTMKINLFKKTKVENSKDFEEMHVTLPKSGKEMTLQQVVNAADEAEEAKKVNEAHPDAMIKLNDGSSYSVKDLVAKHESMCNELADLKKKSENVMEDKDALQDVEKLEKHLEGDIKEGIQNEEDEKKKKEEEAKKLQNEEDEKKKKEEEAKKLQNSIDDKKKKEENFKKLKNAQEDALAKEEIVSFSEDAVARGKSRYGSN